MTRRLAAVAGGGFLAAVLVVVAGGRLGPIAGTVPLTHWMGLLASETVRPGTDVMPGVALTTGMVALAGLWLYVVRVARCTERQTWLLAAAWGGPLALGPPLLSSDVYTYAAQGVMVVRGFDPYRSGPLVLGADPAAAAVDPTWRAATSPYGPLATLAERLAVCVGGGPLGAVIVLRLLAVASVVAIGLLGVRLAGGVGAQDARRSRVLALLVLNPLTLFQLVSAAHFEGLMCAGLLAALVAVRRGHPRLGIVLAFAAGTVKAPAYLAVLAIAAVSVIGLRRAAAARELAAGVLVAAGCAVGVTLAFQPDPWGWVASLQTPAQAHTPMAPVSLLADLVGRVVPFASDSDVTAGVRLAMLGLAGCLVLVLIATADRRPLAATVGYGLLTVALLGPVVYAWYLLWGLVCLGLVVRGPAVTWFLATACLAALTKEGGLTIGQNAAVTAALVLPLLTPLALPVIGERLSRYAPRRPASWPRPAIKAAIKAADLDAVSDV